MSRQSRRGPGPPVARPIFRTWTARPGDLLRGVRGSYEDAELTSLHPAYVVAFHYRLEPKFVAGFFLVPPLSPIEIKSLESVLRVALTRAARADLNDALGQLIAGIGLAPRAPRARDFKRALEGIIGTIDSLFPQPTGIERGVLSAEESVRHFIYSALPTKQLGEVLERCRAERNELARSSRPGRRGYLSLRLFLESLILISRSLDVRVTFPWGREVHGEYRHTQFSRFAREMLRLAFRRGEEAFGQSQLSPEEREDALSHLRSVCLGSDDTFVEHLKAAKAALETDYADRHPYRYHR